MTKISNQYSLTNILTADLANSRLGINNVSPTVALDVTGAGKFSTTVTAGGNIVASGTGNITIQAISSNNFPVIQLVDNRVGGGTWNFEGGRTLGNLALRDSNAGIERMTWTSAGNVGIGTTSPSAKLNINGISSGLALRLDHTSSYSAILSYINGTNFIGFDNLSGAMAIYAGSTERMRILANGEVAIGNTTALLTAGSRGNLTINGATSSILTLGIAGSYSGYLYSDSTKVELSSATQPMTFVTNGFERLRITSTGNVGIGTTSPNGPLSVQANTGNTAIRLIGTSQSSSNNAGIYWYDSNDSTFNGYIGNFSGSFDIYNQRSTQMVFSTNASEKMRITSAGFTKMSNNGTYIGITSNYHEMRTNITNDNIVLFTNTSASPYGPNIWFPNSSPNNTTNYFLSCDDGTNQKAVIYSNGSILNRTGTYGTISDIKFKENIVDATPKLADIMNLKVRNFNLKGEKTKQIGFIAQEFEEVFPSMIDISKEKNTKETYKSIKTSVLIPMLVKSIQELSAKITLLENK
jgi:hypothetical protein